MCRKVLHGLEGSPGSLKALDAALDLVKLYGAELHTLSVEEVPRYTETIGELIEEKEAVNGIFMDALKKAREMAAAKGVPIRCHVIVGHEVKTFVEFIAQQGFDLLVIGFMGHSALYDRVMGSTCQSLVRMAPCTVLVVK
jgi:nucleotide-binding universal stress UspA family protein